MKSVYLLSINGKPQTTYLDRDLAVLNGEKSNLLYTIDLINFNESESVYVELEDNKVFLTDEENDKIEIVYDVETSLELVYNPDPSISESAEYQYITNKYVFKHLKELKDINLSKALRKEIGQVFDDLENNINN